MLPKATRKGETEILFSALPAFALGGQGNF
jgi:hypothetical protein